MAIYLSNPPTLKEYYASLFGSDQSTGSLQAQKWDPITTAIHAPLLNIRGTFIGMRFDGMYELSNRTFTPTTKTRASAKNNPKRHQTIWYEFGLAKNLMYREGAKELLQGSFTAAETYERINAIVQFESTHMIIIHAYNTSIVPGPHDPVVLSNHTIIAACTYHRFNTTKAGITNCFISYLAVTNKQYTRDTVTGFAEKERPHKPFRDGGYGFSWLMIRMASLLSGTNLPARGEKNRFLCQGLSPSPKVFSGPFYFPTQRICASFSIEFGTACSPRATDIFQTAGNELSEFPSQGYRVTACLW